MTPIRRIVQPGPAPPARIQWVEARGRAFRFTLQPGLRLLEAVRRGFAEAGFSSGVLNAEAGALGPFAYVMPALSRTSDHAAYYSDTFRPDGVTRLSLARMTFGQRDGAPFFHCHAWWTEAGGRTGGGHIMPDETVVAELFEVEAFGIEGAVFVSEHDPETNFQLFGPVPSGVTEDRALRRVFAIRLRPNQDFADALLDFCRTQNVTRARIHGGVGSTIGARFSDGRVIEPFATETAVRSGVVAPNASGGIDAELHGVMVDYLGGLAEGRLLRGGNPVLMTMELVLEVL